MTGRLARTAVRHPWRVVGSWSGAVVLALAAMALAFGDLDPEGRLTSQPESVRAHELKEHHFGEEHAATEFVLVRSETLSADEPAFRERIGAVLAELEATGIIAQAGDPREEPGLVAPDGRAVLVPVRLSEEGRNDVEPLVAAVEAQDAREGFEMAMTGTYAAGRDFTELAGRELAEGELQAGVR